eukprot:307492_1
MGAFELLTSLNSSKVLKMADISLMSMVLGQTTWIFFIQSGLLMNFLGREKFVPIMMKITKTFMKINMYCLFGLTVTTFIQTNYKINLQNIPLNCALFGFVCSALNNFIVTPKALSVGGRTMEYRKGKDQIKQNTLSAFAADGGAAFENNSKDEKRDKLAGEMKFYHRSVAGLVVLAAIATMGHAYWIVNRLP